MPIYRFLCQHCGLSFTENRPPNTRYTDCKCGKEANIDLPKNINAVVRGDVKTGAPTNTGLSGIDYSVDRVIGEDAAKKWKLISHRQSDKRDIIRVNKVTGFDLSRNPDNTYHIMRPEERETVERVRNFNQKLINHANRLRKQNG